MQRAIPVPGLGNRSALGNLGPARSGAAAALVIVVLTSVLWWTFDVPAGWILRFVGYIVAFTLVPGVAAWWALRGRRPLNLADLALGWALGYALEVLAFLLTAAIGDRGAFTLYPVLVVALSGAWILGVQRRRPAGPAERYPHGEAWIWVFTAIVCVLLIYVAERYFTTNPLPSTITTGSVSYLPDYVWPISLAAELRHHFPPTLPNISGEKLEYHWFVYAHIAAINQVTGINLSTITLRLYPMPMVIEVALLITALGRRFWSSTWVGLAAVLVALMVGPFDPWPRPPSEFFTHIFESGSYGYGLIFFLALSYLLLEQVTGAAGPRVRLVLIAILSVAAAGAKSSVLPVLGGTMLIVLAVTAFRERRMPWRERAGTLRTAAATAVVGVVAIGARLVLYPTASGELEIKPVGDVQNLYPAKLFEDAVHVPEPVRWLAIAVVTAPAYVKLLLPLLPGLYFALRSPEIRGRAVTWWLLASLATSLFFYSFFWQQSGSQVYFLYYGYVAGAVVSAQGLAMLWRSRFGDVRVSTAQGCILAALVLLPWAVDGPLGSRLGEPTAPKIYQKLDGIPTYDRTSRELTRGMYDGYRWIAQNTPTDAVLATNNRWLDKGRSDARFFYASAFAERRTLLEGRYGIPSGGYDLPSQAQVIEHRGKGLYGDRAEALLTIFALGDPAARDLAKRRWHVTHLVIDRVHEGDGLVNLNAVASLGKVVYNTPSMMVVDVRG
jgi:hypothetical protein